MDVQRFHDVIVRPGIESGDCILFVLLGSDDEDVRVQFVWQGAHTATDLDSIDPWHHPIQQQQSWMMQYQQQQQGQPPAGWNQQSAPSSGQPQQQQYGGGGSQNPGSAGEIRSLWIGDLQPWMDENYLMNVFGLTGEVILKILLISVFSLSFFFYKY